MTGIVAKHRYQMNFCYSHLTRNLFNLYMRCFFFGLVYDYSMVMYVKFHQGVSCRGDIAL